MRPRRALGSVLMAEPLSFSGPLARTSRPGHDLGPSRAPPASAHVARAARAPCSPASSLRHANHKNALATSPGQCQPKHFNISASKTKETWRPEPVQWSKRRGLTVTSSFPQLQRLIQSEGPVSCFVPRIDELLHQHIKVLVSLDGSDQASRGARARATLTFLPNKMTVVLRL